MERRERRKARSRTHQRDYISLENSEIVCRDKVRLCERRFGFSLEFGDYYLFGRVEN